MNRQTGTCRIGNARFHAVKAGTSKQFVRVVPLLVVVHEFEGRLKGQLVFFDGLEFGEGTVRQFLNSFLGQKGG